MNKRRKTYRNNKTLFQIYQEVLNLLIIFPSLHIVVISFVFIYIVLYRYSGTALQVEALVLEREVISTVIVNYIFLNLIILLNNMYS